MGQLKKILRGKKNETNTFVNGVIFGFNAEFCNC